MKKSLFNVICAVFVGLACPALAQSDSASDDKTKWTIDGTQLFMSKNGGEPENMFLKGVCYAPTPIGGATYEPTIGDWFIWNYAGIWKDKDLPAMKKAGMNHLRTYFWWVMPPPREMANWKQEWEKLEEQDQKRAEKGLPPTFDHTPFLDECYKNGIYVIMGLAVNGGEVFEGGLAKQYQEFFVFTAQKIGEKYGDHPAVVGLCIGNEQNNKSRSANMDFMKKLGEMADAFQKEAPDKLVMAAFVNSTEIWDTKIDGKPFYQVFADYFDLWGLNIYAGMDTTLAAFKENVATKPWKRPLIVSEWAVNVGAKSRGEGPDGDYGPPKGTAKPKELTDYSGKIKELKQKWGWMMDHRDFVVGSEYFSWVDEWWKNYTAPPYVLYTDKEVSQVDLTGLKKVQAPEAEWFKPNLKDPGSWKKWRVENSQGQWRAVDGKWIYPTFVYAHEASHDPEWPEEMWGLNAIKPTNRDPKIAQEGQRFPPFNEYGYIYNVDERVPRPTLEALSELYQSMEE